MTEVKVPSFMREDIPTAPSLEGLAVGSEVVVLDSGYYTHRARGDVPIRAEVVKKARVWLTVQEIGGDRRYPREWRFRLDDQTDGSQSNYAARFYTPDQYLLRQTASEASTYLETQKIRLDFGSPWREKGRTIELARIIWAGQNGGHPVVISSVIDRQPPLAVSVDVSTGDHDCDRRIFGTVSGVQVDNNGAPVILVERDV